MLTFQSVFVTVGTTQFEDLVEAVVSVESLARLQKYQCKVLRIQYGAGNGIDSATIERVQKQFSIKIECYDFKANILSDIIASDLIISHAGAGSCIEVLTAKKPLIVVVNDKLMHNHQTELAHQLFIDGHLLYCSPDTLTETFDNLERKLPTLKPYEPVHSNMTKFINHLDTLMGFE